MSEIYDIALKDLFLMYKKRYGQDSEVTIPQDVGFLKDVAEYIEKRTKITDWRKIINEAM